MKIGIIIPVFNNLSYTRSCLQNITKIIAEQQLSEKFPVIVIDDGSTDDTSEWLRQNYPDVHLLNGDGNLWWSGSVNKGARHAIEKIGCTHVLLWNNDIQIEDNYLATICNLIDEYPSETIIGSKIYADMNKSTIWSMGGYFNRRSGKFGMYHYLESDTRELKEPIQADWLTGMGTVVPASVIKKIGYWDAERYPQYHGDTEFTFRATVSGYKNIIDPRLYVWNDISNTGMSHNGEFRRLVRMLTDNRSLYNIRINFNFYRQYSTSILAYRTLLASYSVLIGGFIKWKFLSFFGLKKK
jgi:GT2 family glycosyltransferase